MASVKSKTKPFRLLVEGGDYNDNGRIDVHVEVDVFGMQVINKTKDLDEGAFGAVQSLIVTTAQRLLSLVMGG